MNDLEFNSMDLSWALPDEATNQYLDLLEGPLQLLKSEAGETTSASELISIA